MRSFIRNALIWVLVLVAIQFAPVPEPLAHRIAIVGEASAGGHGNAQTPYTLGWDGWTILGPTAPGSQPNCGFGSANTTPQCWFYVSSSLGSDKSTFTGSGSGTNLTVSGATGTILVGMYVTGNACVPSATTIVSGSGTAWVTSKVTTCSGASLTATNNCATIGSPCATVFAATQQMSFRGLGLPDHLNILCGDTIPFNASGSGRVMDMNHGSGASNQNPAVATTYCPGLPEGSGLQPILLSNCNGGGVQINGNVAITNLRFYNPIRDPASGTYDNTCIGNGNGASFSKGGGTLSSLLLEGNAWDFFTGATLVGAIAPNATQNVIIRRNRLYNSWGGNGFFSGGITGTFVFKENTICNSSWNANTTPPVAPDGLQHNYYFNYGSDTVTPPFPNATTMVADTQGSITAPPVIQGNIECNGSDADQDRPGGESQFNLWVQNPGAVSVGGPILNFTDNVITEAEDFPVSGTPNGTALTVSTQNVPLFTTLPTRPQSIVNNIITANNGTGNNAAIVIQNKGCNEALQQCTIPTTGYTITGNTICNWGGTGGAIQRGSAGTILTLNNLVGGTGGTPGIYPLTTLTGGTGTSAAGVVIVGPGGNVTSVSITQFGGLGGLFTAQTASGTPPTLTVSGLQSGGIIIPNTVNTTSGFIEINPGASISSSTITSQVSGTPNGNGVYNMSALPFGANYSGAAQIFIAPQPNPGIGYVAGDTLGITAGSSAGQIPGLTGFSIQVATVAANTDANNLNTIQLANCNGLGPNSTITVGSYNGSIGGTATTNAFIASVLAKSKSDNSGNSLWPYNLSACAVVNAFKAGFGQTPNCPTFGYIPHHDDPLDAANDNSFDGDIKRALEAA